MDKIKMYNADNLEVMATLADESIDVICIDPPYLYLKNQKLERPFDEPKFFAECKRLLTKKRLYRDIWSWYFLLSLEYNIRRLGLCV